MSDTTIQRKLQKTSKKALTVFPHGFNLIAALASQQANQRVSRKNIGGKVDTTQPLVHVCGFFSSIHFSGGKISLPGGYGIKNRSRGNTCGASYVAPRDSRQFYDCHNSRNNIGKTAMNNANTHGTATPVAANQGASSIQCNHCLIPSCVVSDTLNQAQAIAANDGKSGKANAYAELLQYFHAATLPAFIEATNGNISLIARLLGIHRSSVVKYAESVGLSDQLGTGQGGVK